MNIPLNPHDNYSYLTSLAHLVGQDSEAVLSAVERQYTASKFTQPGWFEAVKAEKAALLIQALADVQQNRRDLPLVAGLDLQHPDVPQPGRQRVGDVLATISAGITALVGQYANEEAHAIPPLTLAKGLLAAMQRCYVACRNVEPKGIRTAQQAFDEPWPTSALLHQYFVHLLLLVGQYELPVGVA